MSKIYTVQELAQLLKGNLETRFPFAWVRGQVSNLSRPGSGHIYFTLKDENACLDAVWFRQLQRQTGEFNPLTGEVYTDGARPHPAQSLRNGEEILCAGKITLYPPQGRLQMVVELAQPVGVGMLQQEFERLKQELWGRGWFALERKRSLPANPIRVAVVTAPSGAVIHDFLRIAETRGCGGEIRLYPSLVQGEGAPESIVSALSEVFAQAWAEVVVLIRGGGSLEDLWAFNSESVAEAIVNSPIPVVTGIGHEPDVSIADLAADVRAATPSHAAQLLWQEKSSLAQQVDEQEIRLQRLALRRLESLEAKLARISGNLQFLSPISRLERDKERLVALQQRLEEKLAAQLQGKTQTLQMLGRDLARSFSPANLQTREIQVNNLFSRLATRLSNRIAQLEAGLIPESHIFSLLNQSLMRYESKLPSPRLLAARANMRLERAESGLALAETRLESLNPLRPLARGYALVQDGNGRIISDAAQAAAGQQVKIMLGRGSLEAEVTAVHPDFLHGSEPPLLKGKQGKTD